MQLSSLLSLIHAILTDSLISIDILFDFCRIQTRHAALEGDKLPDIRLAANILL